MDEMRGEAPFRAAFVPSYTARCIRKDNCRTLFNKTVRQKQIHQMNVSAKLPISLLVAIVTGCIAASLAEFHLWSETYQNYRPPDYIFHIYFHGLRAESLLPTVSNALGVIVGLCAFCGCSFPCITTRYHIPFWIGLSGLCASTRYTWRMMHFQDHEWWYESIFCGPLVIAYTIMFSLVVLLTVIFYGGTKRSRTIHGAPTGINTSTS
jgi:hypothetical protein